MTPNEAANSVAVVQKLEALAVKPARVLSLVVLFIPVRCFSQVNLSLLHFVPKAIE
jgi:hypothetical protein